jgi:hypothetical protein
MPTFLQPVWTPTRCFLNEVLLWVAVQRLPVMEPVKDKDIRDTFEVGRFDGHEIDYGGLPLSAEEAQRLGLPPDPRWSALLEDRYLSPPAFYDNLLAVGAKSTTGRKSLKSEREAAIKFAAACKAWDVEYGKKIQYHTARIFVALKDTSLPAQGRHLPNVDPRAALRDLARSDRDLFDVDPSEIPTSFWRIDKIDFETCAASNEAAMYCHISCPTEDMLALFPGPRTEVMGISRVGDSFVIEESSAVRLAKREQSGRPSYPWEGFHHEVTRLLLAESLPRKKEAGIQLMQDWFSQHLMIRPGRATIGEKLKPYYDRFLRSPGQKP